MQRTVRPCQACFAFVALAILSIAVPDRAIAQTDTTPPDLADLIMVPTTIDVGLSDAAVTLTATVTDNLSGVRLVTFTFTGPSGQIESTATSNLISGTPQSGTYSTHVTFPRFSQPGAWSLVVEMRDLAGNIDRLHPPDLIARGFSHELTVISSEADMQAPELVSLSLSPTAVDVTTDPQIVTVLIEVSDPIAGFRDGAIELRSPSGTQPRGMSIRPSNLVQGNTNLGVYEVRFEFLPFIEPGQWSVTRIVLADRNGNIARLTTEIAGQYTLDVTSVQDFEPPELVNLWFSPICVDISGGAVTTGVRVLVQDVPAGLSRAIVVLNHVDTAEQRIVTIEESDFIGGGSAFSSYETDMFITESTTLGTWEVDRLILFDKAGNRASFTTADLAAQYFDSYLQVRDAENSAPVCALEDDGRKKAIAKPTDGSDGGDGNDANAGEPFSLLVEVSDPDGDPLDVFWKGDLPDGMTITIVPEGGLIEWTPSIEQAGSHVLSLSFFDPCYASDNCIVTIRVVDIPPECVPTSGNLLASIGQPFTHSFQLIDPDMGDLITISSALLPAGATMTPPAGTVAPSPIDIQFDWTPTIADVGSHHVTLIYSDLSLTKEGCFFTVDVVNEPPFCDPDTFVDTVAGQPFTFTLTGFDQDEGDQLTVDHGGLPAGATLTASGTGAVAEATIEWTPDTEDVGDHFVDVVFTDSFGAAMGCRLTIHVLPGNATPEGTEVVVQPPDETTGEPAPVSLQFDEVVNGGETTVTSSTPNETQGAPEGFKFGNPPVVFEITTTADFVGCVEVCFDYSAYEFKDPSKLELLHRSGSGAWDNITTSNDTIEQVICGVTDSFSLFAVAEDVDLDDDGLDDEDEVELYGTDPAVADTDGDGLQDGAEVSLGTSPLAADTDVDGLDDGDEVGRGTDPLDDDSDDDGLGDGDEVALAAFGDCPNPLVADSDADLLTDGVEFLLLLDPCDADTDADGLADGLEQSLGTNPSNPDTDGDGFFDGTEVDMAQGTGCPDPLVADSDSDSVADGAEEALGTDPCNADTDGDTVGDGEDDLPTTPGVTSGFIEDDLRALSLYVKDLPLDRFDAPNNNARKGRRNALCNKLNSAAKSVASGDLDDATDTLESLYQKLDGVAQPSDWMGEGTDEKTIVRDDVDQMIFLISLQ